MKKIYVLVLSFLVTAGVFAQTTIDVAAIDVQYTTTFQDELVIDVATTSSAAASPAVSFANPFKGQQFDRAIIEFDVYNYGDLKVLGALIGFFDATNGRMYFSNGGYLGFNGLGSWLDVNVFDFKVENDFLGANKWSSVKLEFTADGFEFHLDGVLKVDNTSTDVTIATDPENPIQYSTIINFLKAVDTFMFGTGSWWSDNFEAGSDPVNYWDKQNSYLKNVVFTTSTLTSINTPDVDANGQVVSEAYYSITGAQVGADFDVLTPGVYIKRAVYSNGAVKSSKIVKANR